MDEEYTMKVTSLLACVIAGLVFAPCSMAQTLTTLPNTNGLTASGAGVYFDLTDLTGTGLTIESFETSVFALEGDQVFADLWVRNDSYVGNEGSNAGWTFLGQTTSTATGTQSGTQAAVDIFFDTTDHFITAGATNGFALFTNFGIGYQGNGTTATTDFNDGNLALFGDASFTTVFTGVSFSPRVFSGSINYSQVPEPTGAAVLLMGVFGLAVRRNRR